MKVGMQILQSMGSRPHTSATEVSLRGMFSEGKGIEYQGALDWLQYEKKWIKQLEHEPLRFKLTQAGRRKAKALRGGK